MTTPQRSPAPSAPRLVAQAFGGGLALALGLLGGQVVHAAARGLPSFDGLDPSGTIGDETRPRLRMVILGDSTVTAPGIDDPDETWARLVAFQLADRYAVDLFSVAEGGAKSRDVLRDQVPKVVDSDWDVAIVSVGSNDVLRLVPVWRFAANLDQIVADLQSCTRAVILFGVGDLGSIPRLPFPVDRVAAASGHIADWVHRRVARDRSVAKVDQWALTTEPFNSGLHMFAGDLFHPSAEGHRAWADAVIPTVEQVVAGLEDS